MDALATLRKVPFLASATEAALNALAARADLHPFTRREFLYHAGDAVERVYIVREGKVAATITSPEGSAVTFHVADVGELCGQVDLFAGNRFTVSAQALTDGTALAVPADALRRLLASDTASLMVYTGDLARIVTAMTQVAADLVFLDIPHRLARFLLESATPDGRVELPYTQSELAARLGVMRQTLNSALSRLAREGMVRVESARVVHLVDNDRLAMFVAHGAR